MKKKIWVNTIVLNEENFIWYSIMSVVNFVDKILIWDTGSTDKTVDIVNEIKKTEKSKIEFRQIGQVDPYQFTKARQKMLEESRCDWLMILDGDEVWWEESLKKVLETIRTEGNKLDGVVVPFYNLVGDIYHYQEQKAGRYKIAGQTGHLQVKFINKNIPGLHVEKPYGQEGYYNGQGLPIQQSTRLKYVEAYYLHMSFLKRSSKKRIHKVGYEIGNRFDKYFSYPEIFYRQPPDIVTQPWMRMSKSYLTRALIETPLKKFKRRIRGY